MAIQERANRPARTIGEEISLETSYQARLRRRRHLESPITAAELDAIERDAARSDGGSRYYKPEIVIRLIAEIRRLERLVQAQQMGLFEESAR